MSSLGKSDYNPFGRTTLEISKECILHAAVLYNTTLNEHLYDF